MPVQAVQVLADFLKISEQSTAPKDSPSAMGHRAAAPEKACFPFRTGDSLTNFISSGNPQKKCRFMGKFSCRREGADYT
jgi:hypothetical protein